MNDPKRLIMDSNALGVALAGARRKVPSEAQLSDLAQRLGQLGAPVTFAPDLFEHRQVEPSRAESSRAEPSRAEPSRAESSRAEPSRAEPSRAEPGMSPSNPAADRAVQQQPSSSALSNPAASNPAKPLAKWGLGLVSGVGVVLALWFGLGPASSSEPRADVLAGVVSSSASAKAADGAAVESRRSAAPNAPPVKQPDAVTENSQAPAGPLASRAPVPEAAAPPATARVAPPLDAPVAPAPSSPRPASTASRKTRSPATAAVSSGRGAEPGLVSGQEALLSEIEFLKRARTELSAEPLRAYVLTEACRAQYPQGVFIQEREFIAIMALSKVGREQEARSRARLFRTHFPRSAYLKQLAPLLEEP